MNYDDFVKEYMERLQEMMKQQIQSDQVRVEHSEPEEKVYVRYEETNYQVAYIVDLLEKFEEFQQKREIDSMVRENVYCINRERENVQKLYTVVQNVKPNNFYLVPLGMEKTSEQLKNMPHRMVEDIAMGVRYNLPELGASLLVQNDFCSMVHLTGTEMLELAQKNLEKEPFLFRSMETVLLELAKKMGMDENYVSDIQHETPSDSILYVVSNRTNEEGAAFIASKTAMEQIKETLGEDFYILPSSKHEILIMPESKAINLEYMQSMVREINATQVKPKDRLSDSIYRCNGKKVMKVDTFEKEKSLEKSMEPKKQLHSSRGR